MKNLTISLYLYHLARSFSDPIDDVNLASENQPSQEKATLLGQKLQTELTPRINLKNELITQVLHDTYFIDMTFFASKIEPAIDTTTEELEKFNLAALLPKKINEVIDRSMGQTIGIYGEVDSKVEADQALADKYVRSFLKNTAYASDRITASSHSNLFSIPLFEYFCQATEIANAQEPTCHILVLLDYQYEKGKEKLGDYYQDIVDLLCSYHKIKFVDQQATRNYQAAVKVAHKIEKEIDNFAVYITNKHQDLDQLSTMLDKLPLLALEHSRYYGDLEFDLTTMTINQQLYQNSLQKLLSLGSQLDAWQNFSNQTEKIFLPQIQFWQRYLTPSKELGQQLTASIRGIVEIEQAKSDRSLEKTIQIFGAGLAAGGIVASAVSGHMDKPLVIIPQGNTQIHPAVSSIGLSVLAALLIGGSVGWINGFIPALLKSKARSQLPKSKEERSLPDTTNEN